MTDISESSSTNNNQPTNDTQNDSTPTNGNDTLPAPRVPKTHKPHMLSIIRSMPLRQRLERNVEIENRNSARDKKRWDWLQKPQCPEPNSDNESFSSISEEDWDHLGNSSIFNPLSTPMPFFVKEELTLKKRRRASDAITKPPPGSDGHADKRRCVDGSLLKTLVEQPITDTPIPQIFFDTPNANIYIPLHLFKSSALEYILRHELEILHDSKTTKNAKVLGVKALSKTLGGVEEHNSFTYERWLEASDNFVRFHVPRDIDGDSGGWGKTWYMHFKFFKQTSDISCALGGV